MNFLSNLLQAFAKWIGYSQHRSEVRNAPDVKAAAIAKQERAQVDKTTKAVKDKDTKQIRKELAE